jgi:hypothetical protein
MRNLPQPIIQVLRAFELLFSERVWEWAKILLVGAILAPGKRTITAALRVMGLSNDGQFQNYHRVLNRAVWSPWLPVASCCTCCSTPSLRPMRRLCSVSTTISSDGVAQR